MTEDKLSFEIVRPQGMPSEQFAHVKEKYERDLGYELIKAIGDGNFYSVKVSRNNEPWSFSDEDVGEAVRVSLWIGKVETYTYKPYAPKKLGFIQRLKVLFTGYVGIDAINIM